MKVSGTGFEIGNLRWVSIFCLATAIFLALYGWTADTDVIPYTLPFIIGFALGMQVHGILKKHDERLKELESKVG